MKKSDGRIDNTGESVISKIIRILYDFKVFYFSSAKIIKFSCAFRKMHEGRKIT